MYQPSLCLWNITPWILYWSGCGSQHVVSCSNLTQQSIQDETLVTIPGLYRAGSACSVSYTAGGEKLLIFPQDCSHAAGNTCLSCFSNGQPARESCAYPESPGPAQTHSDYHEIPLCLPQSVSSLHSKNLALTIQDFHIDLCLITHPIRHLLSICHTPTTMLGY